MGRIEINSGKEEGGDGDEGDDGVAEILGGEVGGGLEEEPVGEEDDGESEEEGGGIYGILTGGT